MGRCHEFLSKTKEILKKDKVVLNIGSLLLYLVDVVTDIISIVNFYQRKDFVWGSLTLVFVILPLIIIWISFIHLLFAESEGSVKFKFGMVIVSICIAPFLPFIIMAWLVAESIKETDSDTAVLAIGFVKFFEGILESFPQACLQMYIICQALQDETKVIGAWQWASLTMSIITLSFSVSNAFFFKDTGFRSKVAFLFFGILAITARLVVCCLLSLAFKPLWFVPICTEIVLSISVWLLKRFYRCSSCLPLTKIHHKCNREFTVFVPLTWVMTALYNSFTISSILISVVNLGFAIGGYFFVSYPIGIFAMSLAAINFGANLLLLIIPPLKCIGNDWLQIEDGKSNFY